MIRCRSMEVSNLNKQGGKPEQGDGAAGDTGQLSLRLLPVAHGDSG